MNERWRSVAGFAGAYEVSDHGRVRSLDRFVPYVLNGKVNRRQCQGQMLSARPNTKGYSIVNLSDCGRDRTEHVHKLVLDAFVGVSPAGQEARHLNGDRRDCRLSNLTWGTRSENAYDKVRHGTHHQTRKMLCPRSHSLKSPNLQPTSLRHGRRDCYACSKARRRCSYYRARGVEMDFATMADSYYAEIVGTSPLPEPSPEPAPEEPTV